MTTESAGLTVSRDRRIGFYALVMFTLALVIFGLGELLAFGVVGWFGAATLEEVFPGAAPHRFHSLAHALFAWFLVISVVVQLRRPETKLAPAVFALVAMLAYTIGNVISGVFDPLEAVAIAAFLGMVWLHPGRGGLSLTPFNRRALLASIPILAGAAVVMVSELGRQLSGVAADPHVVFGHYALMGMMAVILVLAVLAGSSSLVGSRIVAGLASGGIVYLGVASVLFPREVSSLGGAAGVAAVAAGLIFGLGALSGRRTASELPEEVEKEAMGA